MADLTPEDRQRIYEEEKARLEAREQLKAERSADSADIRNKLALAGAGMGVQNV